MTTQEGKARADLYTDHIENSFEELRKHGVTHIAANAYSQDNIKVLCITLFHRAVIFFDIRLFFKPFMLYVV